jgi:SAM-dependent methyltransferase
MASSPSNRGYAETSAVLIPRYEALTFEQVHGGVMHLFPPAPAAVLDVGAGTGRDAAALARRGYTVTAVEPTGELRAHGEQAHAGLGIRWLDDMLPDLEGVRRLGERFDLILLTAVWMHLDAAQRRIGMARLAGLLAPGGVVSMSLRHGPVPEGRTMFDVSAQETAALALPLGLERIGGTAASADMLDRGDVSWSFLVLQACHTP